MIIGIIGGSGFYSLSGSDNVDTVTQDTPWRDMPVILSRESLAGTDVLFLPRHGSTHGIPPHRINYRANIQALKAAGADAVFAVNVVGGITPEMAPGHLVVPDQIIDYTWGRAHTFFDVLESVDNHIDFTWPYDTTLRKALTQAAERLGLPCSHGGVYGCTQGPRLESAAEIRRLQRDGCDIVGMTGMPEAALARELDLPYASIALVVNWAAGVIDTAITFDDIHAILATGIDDVRRLLAEAITLTTA